MQQANSLFSDSKKSSYAVSFFLPVVIYLTIFLARGVFPIGENCFLKMDMYHQYAPFLMEFREKLRSGGSLLYSWNVGLGVNFTALYAYYLASPFNWLVALVPQSMVIEFMMVMMILKSGLCGVTMNCYLRCHSESRDIGTAFFAVLYALSGYMCAYYWNVMWLDCIVLFPLIVLGAERLYQGGSGLLYAGALGVSILSNYYISIMICMFLIVYYFAMCFLDPPENVKDFFVKSLRYALYSLLAGGISAALLFPELLALQATASADFTFPRVYEQYFSIVKMLARHLPCVETEQGLDHWPNIYCGTAVFLFFGMYLLNGKIRLREKAVYVTLLILYLASFSINLLNFVCHGLHYPNSLPARHSFIYIFLLVFVCYRSFDARRALKKRQFTASFLAAFAFILYLQDAAVHEDLHFAVYYGGMLALSLSALLVLLDLERRYPQQILAFSAVLLLAAELASNTAVTSGYVISKTDYTKNNDDIRELFAAHLPPNELVRAERITRLTKNDGAWLGFPSVSLFSSVANADCTKFFKKIGCEASTNAYSITGSTPLVNMLMGVRYAVYNKAQMNGEEKTFVESSGSSYLYRNNYALSPVFALPKGVEDWTLSLDNPANVQNSLCDALKTGTVLKINSEPASESGRDFAVTIGEDGDYYAFVTNASVKKVTVTLPESKKTYENLDRRYFIELGSLDKGDTVRMRSETEGKDMKAVVYRFDYGALSDVYDILSASQMETEEVRDGYLRGRIRADASALGYRDGSFRVFASIPYDKGWKVLVDGQETETEKYRDALLSFEVPDGEHELELKYVPEGLVPGVLVSVGSLLLLAICTLFYMMRRRRETLAPVAVDINEYLGPEGPETGEET